ncbi:hypothetical protein NEOLEDRAFT_523228 [Neolentinus lepideus HHB14362 ss-1]|uniref:Uncharacterized protein n=1 Tax=Neolentinus lepideus HHB14362 ss-1 TaxID=1314782 RepID=A0A165RCR2_9AGAM|nr:hypothetical protein NEOLEDRAFT_523228 [Neolentinus lepideus HHB14362 ss-1]
MSTALIQLPPTSAPAVFQSIQNGTSAIVALIEREKEKAVASIRKDYLELEQRFAAFRSSSEEDLRAVSHRVSVWRNAAKNIRIKLDNANAEADKAQNETKAAKEAYKGLRDALLLSDLVQQNIAQVVVAEQTEHEDLRQFVSLFSVHFGKNQEAMATAQKRCAELELKVQQTEQAKRKVARLEAARRKLQDTLRESSALREMIQEKELAIGREDTDEPFDVITLIPDLLDRFQKSKDMASSLRARLAEAESQKQATRSQFEARIAELRQRNSQLR